MIDVGEIDEIDELRWRSPAEAVRKAEAAMETAEASELLRLLGVMGTALRMQSLLPEARRALGYGLRLARRLGDDWAVADLQRRLAYCYGNDADFRSALTLTDRALARFVRIPDLGKTGECLTDRGQWLYQMEDYRRSIRTSEAALELLPSEEQRHRFTCELGIGYCWIALGRPRRATAAALSASAIPVEPALGAAAAFLAAELAEGRSEYESAQAHYLKAAEGYRDANHSEAALASIKALEMTLRAGRPPSQAHLDLLGALILRARNRQIGSALTRVRRLATSRAVELRHLAQAAMVIRLGERKTSRAPKTVQPPGSG